MWSCHVTQRSPILSVDPQKENISPCRNLYANVCSSSVHNNLKVETAHMSLNERMDKPSVVHAYGRLFIPP